MTRRSGEADRRRGSETELRSWIDLGLAACDEADEIARRYFRRDLEITRKPDRTLVTTADTAIEARIRDRLQRAHPDHGIVGEEHGSEAADASTRWYIDPIDGTHNFVRGVPLFATLIAVERDGEIQAGVISAPALRERWYAWRGGGAWAEDAAGARRRLNVSGVGSIADAHVLYGSGREIEDSGLAPGFGDLVRRAWRDRGFGDFWGYTLVAAGAAEVMFEVGLAPWDAAAPLILVEEAGGRATDVDGGRTIGGAGFVATNGRLHDEVLARLRGAAPR